jgi:nitrite reductase/ring-hydroxylating ferredoxin subunit
VDGNAVLLINIEDRIYAYADVCPHQKSRLSEGSLLGNALRCARHHWEFDVRTGHGINPRNACLKVFPVTIDGRDVLVDVDGTEPREAAAAKVEHG